MRPPKDGGWFWLPNSLIDTGIAGRVGPLALAVYVVLRRHAGEDGVAWPSLETVARESGRSRKQVKRIIGQLAEAGMISIYVKRDGKSSNRYRFPQLGSPVTPEEDPIKKTNLKRPKKNTHTPASPDVCVNGDAIDLETKPLTVLVGPGFEGLWEVYPRKTRKAKAKAVWDELAPDASRQLDMIAAVERLQMSDQWRRGVIPNLDKWLHESGWEDDLPGPPAVEGIFRWGRQVTGRCYSDDPHKYDGVGVTLSVDSSPEFVKFAEKYRGCTRLNGAEEVWKKLGCGAIPHTILAALHRDQKSEEWQKDRGKFVPGAAKWLQSKPWETDPPRPSEVYLASIGFPPELSHEQSTEYTRLKREEFLGGAAPRDAIEKQFIVDKRREDAERERAEINQQGRVPIGQPVETADPAATWRRLRGEKATKGEGAA
jgi:hypothetical protein